ncbi:hypothetical protein GCM10011583_63400 [Streptomyces camponoticapitis]|uniref:DUF397 domain-containing protein n=1 Tax=Streptomyces camponoticapitis TaxID=1616125 RepID=A0ABQ2EVF3_9ACTN|nr:DUF397 domain-containing protein [Streptomyces camponoticapitis]GGK22778.1 hypothetical protein GCM10011583_63400 [Streptomyces camponoticapitis]
MTVQPTEPTTPRLEWFKSSYSTGNGGECVEVAAAPTHVHIRDSKWPSGPMLTLGPGAWASFVGLIAD